MIDQREDHQQPLIRPSFIVFGDGLNPDETTSGTGIVPTSTGIKGQKTPGRRFPSKDTFWEIQVDRRCYYIDGPISEVIDMVWDKRDLVLTFIQRPLVSVHLYCAVSLFGNSAGYSLSAKTIKRLACFGAEFSLDIIDYEG